MTGLVDYPSASGYTTQFYVSITDDLNCETGNGVSKRSITDFEVTAGGAPMTQTFSTETECG